MATEIKVTRFEDGGILVTSDYAPPEGAGVAFPNKEALVRTTALIEELADNRLYGEHILVV